MACGNLTSIKTASNGVWQHENPLHFAFPVLIIQTTLVIISSSVVAFFLKPFHQPKVVAEILGGILLGPSALGRNRAYMEMVFPSWSTPILESVASMGLLFFLFLVGLELDLSSLRKTGKRAFGIAVVGMSLPFLLGVGLTFILRPIIHQANDNVGYGQYILFMGVSLSITAFPVLASVLAELKLLTTQIGETAMAAAALNDVAAWVLLALVIAVSGNNGTSSHSSKPLVSLWVLISGICFVAFMLIVVRPSMNRIFRHYSTGDDTMDNFYVCLIFAAVMVSGFVTDFIGIHAVFGAFVFGLTMPTRSEFSLRLIKRVEDFVSGLLLPLYFASSGLKTNVANIRGAEAWGVVVLLTSAACVGKILGTFGAAMICGIPVRESLTIGLLMNTKGLVELIVLNIGKEKKVLSDEMFATLVIMALFTTFMTTPAVMTVYKPPRRRSIGPLIHCKLQQESATKIDEKTPEKLRILACIHGPGNLPSLINLIELIRSSAKQSKLKLYMMQLAELTDRASSRVRVQRARKNGFPCISHLSRRQPPNDQVAVTLETYSKLTTGIVVQTATAISVLSSMHIDICHVADEKWVEIIILPFHKRSRRAEEDEEVEVENIGEGWREVNERVLNNAPCSVAIFVDRGFGGAAEEKDATIVADPKRVCIVFLGGPDSRVALELGGRMAAHPTVGVTLLRFTKTGNPETEPTMNICTETNNNFSIAAISQMGEKELDEIAIAEFQRFNRGAEYIVKPACDISNKLLAIGQSNQYELIIIGKGRFPSGMVAEPTDGQAEHPELGTIGNLLTSSGIMSSVLVVQQHNLSQTDKANLS